MPVKKDIRKKITFFRKGNPEKAVDKKIKAVSRLVAILTTLNNGRAVSTANMAADAGVDQRTIQRDLAVLRNAGFNLELDAQGRHRFKPGFSLAKFELTEEQASLLSFMREIAGSLGGGFENSFKDLFKRLVATDYYTPFYAKMPMVNHPLPDNEIVKDLSGAIDNAYRVSITYEPYGKAKKDYVLEPLKLAFFDGFWYLVANKKASKQIQKFRLDRVETVTVLEEEFSAPLDIDDLLKESVNVWFDAKRSERVLIRVAPEAVEYFKERQFFPLQKVVEERPDGSVILETYPAHSEEISQTIMHWIPCLTVIEPAGFKEKMRQKVEDYLRIC